MFLIEFIDKNKNNEGDKDEEKLLIQKFNGIQEVKNEKEDPDQYSKIGLWSDFCHMRQGVKLIQTGSKSEQKQEEK